MAIFGKTGDFAVGRNKPEAIKRWELAMLSVGYNLGQGSRCEVGIRRFEFQLPTFGTGATGAAMHFYVYGVCL